MLPVDQFRLQTLDTMSKVKAFSESWAIWRPAVHNLCSLTPTAEQIFSLGNHLSSIFQSNHIADRGQSGVSVAGKAWECLIVWYLNLVFWGTNVVAITPLKKHTPKILLNGLAITISNHATNSESDIIVFSIPDGDVIDKLSLAEINKRIDNKILDTFVTVVQCKTSWADNAQIPMLWDLIYNSTGNRIPNVHVGREGVSPTSFGKFSYAFVTVPTPPRQNSCRPDMMMTMGATRKRDGSLRGSIQEPGCGTVIAAGKRGCWYGGQGGRCVAADTGTLA